MQQIKNGEITIFHSCGKESVASKFLNDYLQFYDIA